MKCENCKKQILLQYEEIVKIDLGGIIEKNCPHCGAFLLIATEETAKGNGDEI